MKCECGGDTKVFDSRPSGDNVWRRRECLKCGRRFATYELRADDINELWKQLQAAKSAFVAMGKIVKGVGDV